MRLLVYLPDDEALRGALEESLKRHPKTQRIQLASLPGATFEEKLGPLGDAIAATDKKHGFVITDPPRSAAELKRFDQLCREKLGKNRLPRAVFYVPPKKKMPEGWKEAVKEAHKHFHPSRRAYNFVKPQLKPLRKAVGLAAKYNSPIRWGTLGPMSAFVLVCAVMMFLFRDSILKAATIEGLQTAFLAKADVPGLASDLVPSLGMEKVTVADRNDPMKNLFEFDRMNADIEAGPLFSACLHANELALEGLRFDTERNEDGSLPGIGPEKPAPVEEQPVGPTFEEEVASLLERLNPPSPDDFETVRLAREIEQGCRERLDRLNKMVADNPYKARLEKAKKLAGSMKGLKMPDSAKEALAELKNLKPDAAAIDEAKKELAEVAGIDFKQEAAAIGKAKKDLASAKASLDGAKATVDRAKQLKKVGLFDAPKLVKLIKDVGAVKDGLSTVGEKVKGAQAGLEKAAGDVKAKQESISTKLASADKKIADAKAALEKNKSDLPGRIEKLSPKLAQARKDIEAEKARVQGAVEGAGEGIGAIKADLEKFQKQMEEDIAFMKAAPGRLEAAIEKDKKMVQERYNLENFTADALVKALLGEEVAGYVSMALTVRDKILPYVIRKGGEKPVKTPGPKGTVFHFPVAVEAPPRVWIKKAVFSGEMDLQGEKGRLEGKVTHFSTNMAATGEDMKMEFTVEAGKKKVSAAFVLTTTGTITLDVEVAGFSLDGAKLENKHVRADLSGGTYRVKAKVVIGEGKVEATGALAFDGLNIMPGEGLDPKLAFLGDAMKSVKSMSVDITLAWTADGPSLSVSSGEGADLTKSLRSAMTGQVEAAKEKALAGFESHIAGPRKAADAAVAQFLGQGPGKAKAVSAGVDFGPGGTPAGGADLDNAMKLLSQDPDPKAILASMEQELAGLSSASAKQRKASEGDGAAQSEAAGSALEGAKAESARIGEIKKELDAELERLKGLK